MTAGKTWKPREAADITGVPTALQRQWRKAGVLPDNVAAGRVSTRAWGEVQTVDLVALCVGRALIDAGASYEVAAKMGPVLMMLVIQRAVYLPEAFELGPELSSVTDEELRRFLVRRFGAAHGARYFALRTEKELLGSNNFFCAARQLAEVEYWMAHGEERYDPESDRVDISGDPIPEEFWPTEEDLAERAALNPPLAGARSAIVLDIETILRGLINRAGPLMEIRDGDLDPRIIEAQRRRDEAVAAAQAEEAKLMKELEVYPEAHRAIILANLEAGRDLFEGVPSE